MKKVFKVGQEVMWQPDGAKGVVVEVGYSAIKVRWADGQWGIFGPLMQEKLVILALKASKE